MDKRKVIFYTDELNDEFSVAQITPRKIDKDYVYIHTSRFKRFTKFFWYRIVATPIAFLYVKLVFGQKTKGTRVFEKSKVKGKGYFMYGNHTQDIADAFIPTIINFPQTDYIIVHPNNVSMPVLGKITPALGALPIPDEPAAYKNFKAAIETRIGEGKCVVIYPEAHIWPYYTGIRPFRDTSFEYPAKLGAPVFAFTNTYHRRSRLFRHPRIVTCIDGPFFPDMSKPVKKRRKELRDKVYNAMCKRAESSDHVQIKYIKREK
ncbi:MAG: hypothetical protein IKP47_11265 [Ruminococcus sp.]|nr:hypothetical protein [Ruminococcus sp.]